MAASRVLIELFLFALPFMLFGLYRLAISEAEQDGRKPWPIYWLFGTGLVLAVVVWFGLILLDRGGREICLRSSQLVDGKIVHGEKYECEKDLTRIGKPRTDDPGGQAEGVGDPHPAGPDE